MTSADEVIVVGSGPCGAIAADMLVERGIPVVMLDAGLHPPAGLIIRAAGRMLYRRKGWSEYEQHRHDPSSDPRVQWYSSLSLGGLSNFWTAAIPRFAPEDFTDGARIDERYRWPIGYDDLAPFYERAEEEMTLTSGAPIIGVPSGRAIRDVELPPDWQAVAEQAQHHGQGIGPLPMARGRPTLVARRGTEYSSYHCTVSRLETSPMFRLERGMFVLRLDWNPASGRVESVECIDRTTGERRHIRGRAVVLAAGAIDTTAIILRSTSDDFPDGVGNSAGVVGRYLHDHPCDWWIVETDRPMTALTHPVYVARADHASSTALMASSLTIGATPKRSDRLSQYTGRSVEQFGVQAFGTMVPKPDVGIRLGDWDGARPAIHLRYDDATLQNMQAAKQRIREVLGAGGVRSHVTGGFDELTPGRSVHYGGTVRMHDDPEFGALDRWNRMHDVANVAVVDSSCFTTGPEKNPTLTAMAISARAAVRLAFDLADGPLA